MFTNDVYKQIDDCVSIEACDALYKTLMGKANNYSAQLNSYMANLYLKYCNEIMEKRAQLVLSEKTAEQSESTVILCESTPKYQNSIISNGYFIPHWPYSEGAERAPTAISVSIVWDTGCSRTSINEDLLYQANIPFSQYVSTTKAYTAGGSIQTFLYKTGGLFFPKNQMLFKNLEVMTHKSFSSEVLVGMDIIGSGSFSISPSPFQL